MAQDISRTPSLFLSYAHRDGAEMVRRLRDDLLALGHQVWLDTARLNGGASWSSVIEQAISEADVLVALISAGSYASDVCRGEQLRALRLGKRVIPVLLHDDADRPVFLEAAQFISFAAGQPYPDAFRALTDALASAETAVLVGSFAQTYVTAPRLPKSIVHRPGEIARVCERLLKDEPSTTMEVVAVTGMGGLGKTTLAQMLAHDAAVQAAFPDGVIWIDIGRDAAEFMSRLREVGRALGDGPENYDTEPGSRNRLRTILSKKAVLIILDDVWQLSQVEPFLAESPTSRLLITTRNQEIAVALQGAAIAPDRLSQALALEILERWTGVSRASAPPEAVTIVRECGALPLALAMIGGMVRNGLAKGRSDAWATAVRRLQEARLDVIRQPLENYRYDALERAIEISVDDLDDTIRQRYFTMGIFREDTAVPERVLAILWRCGEDDAQRTVDRWLDTSLATRDANGRITLHDLQLDYARRRVPSLPALHEQLIDRYREHYATEWPAIVGDPYFLQYITSHMAGAERWRDLALLVLDPRYVRAKLDVLSYAELVHDFRWPAQCLEAIDDASSRQRFYEMQAETRRLQFFVDRVDETAIVERWLRRGAGAPAQRSRHFFVMGESGVGKTAFLRHVRFRAVGETTFVVTGALDRSHDVIDALFSALMVIRVQAGDEPERVDRGTEEPADPGEPYERCRQLDMQAMALTGEPEMPLCFVVDDAHRFSAQSIGHVLQFPRWSPQVAFLWTITSDWNSAAMPLLLASAERSSRLLLSNLSEDRAKKALRGLLGPGIDDRIVQFLAERTRGNTALLGELARRLAGHDRAELTAQDVLAAVADLPANRWY